MLHEYRTLRAKKKRIQVSCVRKSNAVYVDRYYSYYDCCYAFYICVRTNANECFYFFFFFKHIHIKRLRVWCVLIIIVCSTYLRCLVFENVIGENTCYYIRQCTRTSESSRGRFHVDCWHRRTSQNEAWRHDKWWKSINSYFYFFRNYQWSTSTLSALNGKSNKNIFKTRTFSQMGLWTVTRKVNILLYVL